MKTPELIQEVAARAGLTAAEAEAFVTGLFDASTGLLSEVLDGGADVDLGGFGELALTWKTMRTGGRLGGPRGVARVPQVGFRAGGELRERLGSTRPPRRG